MNDKSVDVKTNNHKRELFPLEDCPLSVRKDFDYIKDDSSLRLFSYRGEWYDLREFMVIANCEMFPGDWDVYQSDSYFSGVLARYPREDNEVDFENVIVGRYWT